MWEGRFGCRQAKLFFEKKVRVLVTRSREDAVELMRELDLRNIQAILAPLLTIKYLAKPILDLDGVQALLMTSVNGVRAFSAPSVKPPALLIEQAERRADARHAFSQ